MHGGVLTPAACAQPRGVGRAPDVAHHGQHALGEGRRGHHRQGEDRCASGHLEREVEHGAGVAEEREGRDALEPEEGLEARGRRQRGQRDERRTVAQPTIAGLEHVAREEDSGLAVADGVVEAQQQGRTQRAVHQQRRVEQRVERRIDAFVTRLGERPLDRVLAHVLHGQRDLGDDLPEPQPGVLASDAHPERWMAPLHVIERLAEELRVERPAHGDEGREVDRTEGIGGPEDRLPGPERALDGGRLVHLDSITVWRHAGGATIPAKSCAQGRNRTVDTRIFNPRGRGGIAGKEGLGGTGLP